jgi:hypothetical protein
MEMLVMSLLLWLVVGGRGCWCVKLVEDDEGDLVVYLTIGNNWCEGWSWRHRVWGCAGRGEGVVRCRWWFSLLVAWPGCYGSRVLLTQRVVADGSARGWRGWEEELLLLVTGLLLNAWCRAGHSEEKRWSNISWDVEELLLMLEMEG